MKTIELKLYKFSELSETAKEKAVEDLADINFYYDWWEYVFDDAEKVGIKLTWFDIENYCNGEFYDDPLTVAGKIISLHGSHCDTYKTAEQFINDRDKLVEKYSDGITIDRVDENNEYEFDTDLDDLEAEFLRSILEDYRILLSKEYDYLTSSDAIIETIEANDYDFTEDGKLY